MPSLSEYCLRNRDRPTGQTFPISTQHITAWERVRAIAQLICNRKCPHH
ncbi:MAG: hypothetical protein WCD18_06455 [Thermosynechococcaceae cyanobacterium]